MPVVARDRSGSTPGGYGLLLSAVGVGGLTGALLLAAVAPRVPRGRLLRVASVGFAGLLVAFSFVRSGPRWRARCCSPPASR